MASLRKNVASQHISFVLVNSSTGAALTGATFTSKAWVAKDGSQAGFAGTFTELGNGQYDYSPTQSETNCTSFGLAINPTSSVPVNLQMFTDNWDTTAAVITSGSGTAQLTVTSGVASANTTQIAGATVDTTKAQVGANLVNIAGTASKGTAGYVGIDWAQISAPTTTVDLSGTTIKNLDTVPPTAAAIATAVWQDSTAGDFTTANSIGKSLYTSGVVPGAAGGLFIAGTNAATTVNFTGNMSGSVGSVTGAVGSVTGAVGSVTGAVGSVTGAVGSVTGNVGGNVVGSVASVTAAVTVDGTSPLTEAYPTKTDALTLASSLYSINEQLANRTTSGTTITVLKRDQATTAMTFTIDDATNTTSIKQS
jgi:hypothetical protein